MASPDDSSSTSELTPNQIRAAYGMGTYSPGIGLGERGNLSARHVERRDHGRNGHQGNGSGQTIAIVDAYDDPNALSDLNAFSSYRHLGEFRPADIRPAGKRAARHSKSSINTAGTSPPNPDLDGKYNGSNNDWEMEESLDMEWAHAMAPMANIILVEANSASPSDLFQGRENRRRPAGRGCRLHELGPARGR